jgi:hypothetical protein
MIPKAAHNSALMLLKAGRALERVLGGTALAGVLQLVKNTLKYDKIRLPVAVDSTSAAVLYLCALE